MSKRVICVAFALIIGGCGGGDGSSSDSASPPGNDLGPPNPDAAPGTDVGVPAPDAAPGTDGGPPPPTDLGADAPTHNPLITSDPDPDEVACGGATCHPSQGEVCCVSMLGMSCKPASACVGLAAPAYCDGPEDCPSGQHCCVGFPSGAKCNATACSGTSQELCNFDQDCATQHCTPCKGPGSSLVYGLCTAGTTCPSPYISP